MNHTIWRAIAFLLSPIAEKNPVKALASLSPVSLSAGRLVRAAVALVWSVAVWRTPELLTTWPAATLGALVVFGPELAHALRSVDPETALEFGKELMGRFGIGAGATTVHPIYRDPAAPPMDNKGEPEGNEPA